MARAKTPVKDTYSTHDVAKICCVTPTTVIRWIEDGLIPAFKTVGGHRRVRREDLEKVCRDRGIPFNVPTGTEVGRILVVDDEPVVLDLVRDVVKELSHKFEVEVAKDAFDAGRLVVAFRPQLIFLDLMMPGVDGFEVCARLKKDPATTHTEIIAITGYYTEANMERILSAGAAACLKKPLDVLEVRRQVLDAFNLQGEQAERESGDDETAKVLIITQNADFRSRVREELAHADRRRRIVGGPGRPAALRDPQPRRARRRKEQRHRKALRGRPRQRHRPDHRRARQPHRRDAHLGPRGRSPHVSAHRRRHRQRPRAARGLAPRPQPPFDGADIPTRRTACRAHVERMSSACRAHIEHGPPAKSHRGHSNPRRRSRGEPLRREVLSGRLGGSRGRLTLPRDPRDFYREGFSRGPNAGSD
jgi:excisionase family DNA binding protein